MKRTFEERFAEAIKIMGITADKLWQRREDIQAAIATMEGFLKMERDPEQRNKIQANIDRGHKLIKAYNYMEFDSHKK